MLSLFNYIYPLFSLIPSDTPKDMVSVLIFIYVLSAFIVIFLGLGIWGLIEMKYYPEKAKREREMLSKLYELEKKRKKEKKEAKARFNRYYNMALDKYPGIGKYAEQEAYIKYLYEIDA